MTRTPEQVLDAMAAVARRTAVDDAGTWRDALFTARPDGGSGLSAPGEPDQALLAALAAEYATLDTHAALLGPRRHVAWLEQILRVPRLPAVPDQVVAHAGVDPALAPAVLPPGTELRGGKDAVGNERRYRTLDALTAHGTALLGVRALVPGGTAPGEPGVALSVGDLPPVGAPWLVGDPPSAAREFPLAPPSSDVEAAAGPDATHALRVSSPALAFPDGQMRVKLTFVGASSAAVQALHGAGDWWLPTADGTVVNAGKGLRTTNSVTLLLTGGCVDPDREDPWLEWVLQPGAVVPEGLTFTRVDVSVTQRDGVVPQAAFANDGALDVTKEFQPFGVTAKRGDALYLRCDEALSKRLGMLRVSMSLLPAAGGSVALGEYSAGGPGGYYALSYEGGSGAGSDPGALGTTYISTGSHLANQYALEQFLHAHPGLQADLYGALGEIVYGAAVVGGNPSIQWQCRDGGDWDTVAETAGSLKSVTVPDMGGAGSEEFAVSGQPGRYLRGFLHEGDFGWTAYQKGVQDFATGAVAGSDPTMPSLPVPPIVTALTLSYTTKPVAANRVAATSGWRSVVLAADSVPTPFTPFRRAVSDAGHTGTVAFGLVLPEAALGASVSLYLDLGSAAPCGATDEPDAVWQWWDGATWQELVVADGTRFLREAGLLRLIAPRGWATGCPDVSASAGRWLRLVTRSPRRLGALRGVHPDAVLAEFVSSAPDPSADPSGATALAPGTIKGTVVPVRGVKKVTNVASVRGRGPEADTAFARRAATRVRHRDRALNGWDYEQIVAVDFPEVAALRCLPHTAADGARAPGRVGLVVVPDEPTSFAPRPSVRLAGRIAEALGPRMPVGARLSVLCPDYVPVTVTANVLLRRGVAALTGRAAVTSALEALLHPTGTLPVRWGRTLYASTLVAVLEKVPEVDVVPQLELRGPVGPDPVAAVEVDVCRGLYCSSGAHVLTCEEQL